MDNKDSKNNDNNDSYFKTTDDINKNNKKMPEKSIARS